MEGNPEQNTDMSPDREHRERRSGKTEGLELRRRPAKLTELQRTNPRNLHRGPFGSLAKQQLVQA